VSPRFEFVCNPKTNRARPLAGMQMENTNNILIPTLWRD
jgi:hypothetical protein